MLSASTDLPQVQSYHNQYFYSLDFALFINKKQNKGGESLPLAHTTLLATPSSGVKFILTQPPQRPKTHNACKKNSKLVQTKIAQVFQYPKQAGTNRDRPRKSPFYLLHQF